MLRGVPLLSGVSTEVLADLAALSVVQAHPPGKVLFSEGDPADAFYVVIDGSVTASRRGRAVFEVHPGDEFGALAVLDERPREFTITAQAGCRLLRIGGEDFLYLLEQHPGLARGVIRHLAREVRSTIGGRSRYVAADAD